VEELGRIVVEAPQLLINEGLHQGAAAAVAEADSFGWGRHRR
jgi:hypothetical protein